MDNIQKRDAINISGLWIYGIVGSMISLMALFGGRAFESSDITQKIIFYMVFLIGFLIFITIDKLFLKVYDLSYIHDPEKGAFNFIPLMRKPLFLLLLSFVIFTPIFLFSALLGQQSFIGYTSFQVAKTASLWTAIEPAVLTETLIVALLTGSVYFLSSRFSSNRKNKVSFISMMAVGLVVVTLFMYMLHSFRYGSSETSLFSVILFFSTSVFILMTTASIIPLVVIHALNNGMAEARKLFGSDLVLVITILIYFLIVAGFIFYLYLQAKKGKKK